jgi:hypothetical protein
MTTIPFAFLRPPGCFTSSDACELLIRYRTGSISHYRNAAGAAHETFLALPQTGGEAAVLIWKDPDGRYFRGRLATLEVAAVGQNLADVMPPIEAETHSVRKEPRPSWRPAEARTVRPSGSPGLAVPALA